MPPTYVFLIDVSYRAVQAGILPTIAEAIKGALDTLPGGERTHVGFITFDSSLHFYKLSPGASAPQMMVSPSFINIRESSKKLLLDFAVSFICFKHRACFCFPAECCMMHCTHPKL